MARLCVLDSPTIRLMASACLVSLTSARICWSSSRYFGIRAWISAKASPSFGSHSEDKRTLIDFRPLVARKLTFLPSTQKMTSGYFLLSMAARQQPANKTRIFAPPK